MSVFISYNYKTGRDIANAVATELRGHKIDSWWLKDEVPLNQLDQIVERVLASCQRCIVVWSTLDLSNWQRIEIEAIRQRLLMRYPPTDTTDFFLIIRDHRNKDILPNSHLPLMECSEYIDYGMPGKKEVPDLSHLTGILPGQIPLTIGISQKKPCFHLSEVQYSQGKQVFIGGFKEDNVQSELQYCWLLLEDKEGRWYIQHPRPTLTHANRWISPSVCISDKHIRYIVLIAANLQAHKNIVSKVLAGVWGAIDPKDLNKVTELDRVRILESSESEEPVKTFFDF